VSRSGLLRRNTIVGLVGAFLESWPTTNFWLLHAAFALGLGWWLVVFKLAVQRQLQVEE
jgi:proton-dependent oligopeptide transporter, POT family